MQRPFPHPVAPTFWLNPRSLTCEGKKAVCHLRRTTHIDEVWAHFKRPLQHSYLPFIG